MRRFSENLDEQVFWRKNVPGLLCKRGEQSKFAWTLYSLCAYGQAQGTYATIEGHDIFPGFRAEAWDTNRQPHMHSSSRYIDLVRIALLLEAGGFRGGAYANPEVDKLLAEASRIVDLKKRGDLYHQVQKLVVDDAPWIFVDNALQNAAGTKKVSGFKLHPSFYLFFDKISVAP